MLFKDGVLYHSLPKDLNDPFECKPHYKHQSNGKEALAVRKLLEKMGRKNGFGFKKAKAFVSQSMANPQQFQQMLVEAQSYVYNKARVCCFTENNEHLLFWAHYANSHKGFCVEFNLEKMATGGIYKVKYQNDYPTVSYPPPEDDTMLSPVLIKSKVWEYENEFRSIIYPKAPAFLPETITGIKLNNDSIKAVYFGQNIKPEHRDKIVSIIKSGPFEPELWQAELKQDSYGINFKPYKLKV